MNTLMVREPGPDLRAVNYDQVARMKKAEQRELDKKRAFQEQKGGTAQLLEYEAVAAGFLLDEKLMRTRVALLSEGQKGLLVFARLVIPLVVFASSRAACPAARLTAAGCAGVATARPTDS